MRKRNPIIYLSGPEYRLDDFSPIILEIQDHFQGIINTLVARNKNGSIISVNLQIDDLNPEKVSAYAKRVRMPQDKYEIYLGSGFIHYLWTASRFLMTDFKFLSWIKSVKLSKELRRKGRKESLSDFVFYILVYHVLLHELAHIYLGHCDYLQEEMNISEINEYDERERSLILQEKKMLIAIEADADRQAGEWLVGFIDMALGTSGRGTDLVFPSRMAVYEFLVYAYSISHVLNQQLTGRKDPSHPLPNQRQYTAISTMLAYFSSSKPEEDFLHSKIPFYVVEAAKKTGLHGIRSVEEFLETAVSMIFVNEIINKIGIRKYQHVVELSQ